VNGTRRFYDWLAVVAILSIAIGYTISVLWHNAQLGYSNQSYDIYAEHYPGIVYALRSLAEGHGLLWNRLQNCGVPFLPNSQQGTLYPLNLLFLLFDIPTAYFVLCAVHLSIGGLGTYFLCREYKLSPTAALCGGISFTIGHSCITLGTWLPATAMGAYIWVPTVMLLCERVLSKPTITRGICLGLALTIQLSLAYPQTLFYTYQLLALRALWEFSSLRTWPSFAVLRSLAIGLFLPLCLGAISLLPSLEFARGSVRGRELAANEVNIMPATWQAFRLSVSLRSAGDSLYGTIFSIFPTALVGFAIFGSRRTRIVAFYGGAAVLYLLLSFENPVATFYQHLPLGRVFREPIRFLWMAGFALNILVALGADAALGVARDGSSRLRLRLAAGGIAAVAGFAILGSTRPLAWEWALLAAGLAALAWAARSKKQAWLVVLPVLVALNLWAVAQLPFLTFLKDESVPYRNRDAFEFVKSRITLQERMYQYGSHPDFSIMPRSGMMFDVPSVTDYEPQATQRIASMWTWTLFDSPMTSINQFYYPIRAQPHNRALLDLLATRYIVIDATHQTVGWFRRNGFRNIWRRDNLLVYENLGALPRALYVPRVEVVSDPEVILKRLASGTVDSRRVALVESEPADGFTGHGGVGVGEVTIVADESEVLHLRVHASDEGFLSLTDQFYSGWEASVNGSPAPITRANYAFRIVRVPAGDSEIVFTYRPLGVRLGAAISLVTALVLILYAGFRLRLRRGNPGAQPI
jgi:hypothetical protein